MASEVEEYLDRFDAVQRLAERIDVVADQIQDVSELLRDDPREAVEAIPSDWPTAEQLRAMLTEMADAVDQLPLYWAKVPERIRNSMPGKHPDRALDDSYDDGADE